MPTRLTPAERQLRAMSETALQLTVEEYMTTAGWRCWYHAPDNRPVQSRRGRTYVQNIRRGFPDLIAVAPRVRDRLPRLVGLELKREVDSDPTTDQLGWLAELRGVGAFVAVCRPRHLPVLQAVILRGSAWPDVDALTFEPILP